MDPDKNTEEMEELAEVSTADESVEDFIKELEAKEKDLHITAETTFIELASDFDADELPEFLKAELPAVAPPEPGSSSAGVQPAADDSKELIKLEQHVADLMNRVAVLQRKITELQDERREMHQTAARRAKDFEAYKTRTERQRRETSQIIVSDLATKMLPALDNLNRAVEFTDDGKGSDGFKHFFDGIVLVNQQVNEVLAGMGISAIPSVGEQFDPHFHEAVATDDSREFPPNTISAELLRGYCIGDKVIRHSMVKVSRPGKSAEPVPEPNGDIEFSGNGSQPVDTEPEELAGE